MTITDATHTSRWATSSDAWLAPDTPIEVDANPPDVHDHAWLTVGHHPHTITFHFATIEQMRAWLDEASAAVERHLVRRDGPHTELVAIEDIRVGDSVMHLAEPHRVRTILPFLAGGWNLSIERERDHHHIQLTLPPGPHALQRITNAAPGGSDEAAAMADAAEQRRDRTYEEVS